MGFSGVPDWFTSGKGRFARDFERDGGAEDGGDGAEMVGCCE